jgi:hypothetical protein
MIDSTYRTRLGRRIDALGGSAHRGALAHALSVLDSRAGTMTVELGTWHGDWAPWNMAARDGRLVVWDWEHLTPGVPVGLDAVHHDFSRLVVLESCPIRAAFDRLLEGRDTALTDQFVTDGGRALLVTVYLLEIATRYIEDGEYLVACTPTSRLREWLAPALSRCERALEDLPRP